MDLLKITHVDFTLYVDCTKYEAIWGKAVRNIGNEDDSLKSLYSWTEGVESVELNGGSIENGAKAQAIFFDNAEYPVWVDFKEYVKRAEFGSHLQSDNERFSFRGHTLAGFLNYGNDIGKSEINIIYQVGTETKRFTFGFEVLSTKLNYHEHWKTIVEDIEREYRMLSLDYMRRTFHGFSPNESGETPELIWWSVFAGEQEKFVKACKSIIERPRHRLHNHTIYQRADKLRRVPVAIEYELAENRRNPSHLYCVEEQMQTIDTQENRFLKYALKQITNKYEALKRQIESIDKTSETMKESMKMMLDTLHHLQRNPFFRTVGQFKGLNQESLVLQRASGYSQVYRTWNLLRRAYSLNEGIYRLQTKNIATLYEIWCFIEVSHIVRELLQISPSDMEHRNRMEMNGLFSWELGRGEHSCILFRKDGVELAELVYNPKHDEEENDSISIDRLVVPTVPQRPDIVLQLTKDDVRQGMKMTYLFDAKYRIAGRENGVDTPPDDAINQMHRYRDAIYYKENEDASLKKEIIGGYILFPGSGEPNTVQMAKFHKSINEVNIGAFPLRPKDELNRILLENFIGELIAKKSEKIISDVITQKGTVSEINNRVLVGLVKNDVEKFENGTATLYYTGKQFPTTVSLDNLHWFVPYIKEKGIRDVYEIKSIRTMKSSEAKNDETAGDDLRLAFELGTSCHLHPDHPDYQPHDLKINHTFTDTTLSDLD